MRPYPKFVNEGFAGLIDWSGCTKPYRVGRYSVDQPSRSVCWKNMKALELVHLCSSTNVHQYFDSYLCFCSFPFLPGSCGADSSGSRRDQRKV